MRRPFIRSFLKGFCSMANSAAFLPRISTRRSALGATLALALSLPITISAQKKVKMVGFYADDLTAAQSGLPPNQIPKLSYVDFYSIKIPADDNVSDEFVCPQDNSAGKGLNN